MGEACGFRWKLSHLVTFEGFHLPGLVDLPFAAVPLPGPHIMAHGLAVVKV